MAEIQTYTSPTNSYSLVECTSDQIEAHCTAYMDYISLANNVIYDDLEIADLQEKMQSAVSTNTAYSILRDGLELGFIYLHQVSLKKFYVSVLHTYDIDSDPIPKLLLMQEVYAVFPDARYYPKDIYSMQNISLLNPKSYRSFRVGHFEYIRFQDKLWDSSLLSYLNLV